MGSQRILTLARFTLLEARRTRLYAMFAFALVLVYGFAYFFQQLAITESDRVQIIFSAAASRLAAVFVLGLYILTCIVREFNDKGLELTLSFDLRRSDYVAGRLSGFLVIALILAVMAGIPQFVQAPAATALQWTASLALELFIVAALSVFCVMTFTQLMPAASFIVAFYLLARTLSSIQLMGDAPLSGAESVSHQMMAFLIDALALVLPSLDKFTQSAWLTDAAAGWAAIGACAVQALLYAVLLAAAAIFDFYRRNI